MNQNQFNVLVYLDANSEINASQRMISDALSISLGTANKTIGELKQRGYIDVVDGEYVITKEGYTALSPYKVKRAVIIAAGFGSRLVPVTLNTPKPLVRVRGKMIIETMLDAILAAGIDEIILVRGYLKDNFDVLLRKYPMIQFVENDVYNEANNISSVYKVKNQLQNTLLVEADLLLLDPTIIRKYEFTSNYRALKVKVTDDWCFDTKGDTITGVKIGGTNVYQMIGISYWTAEDGKKLEEDVERVFKMPGGKEKYWDEVALTVCKERYAVQVYPVSENSIIEIDTYNELCEIDPIYRII